MTETHQIPQTDRIGKATVTHTMQRVSDNLEKQKETMNRQMASSKTRGKIKVTCCSQGNGLTVTSACDLGETCHLGLFLQHAVIAQGSGASPTGSRMHQVSSLLSAQSTTVTIPPKMIAEMRGADLIVFELI